jgi:hypothetical protein
VALAEEHLREGLDVMTLIRNAAYAKWRVRLAECKDVAELLNMLTDYGEGIVNLDMMQCAIDMTPTDFLDFRAGLWREGNGEENTDEWLDRYNCLLLPRAFARLIQLMELVEQPHEDQG